MTDLNEILKDNPCSLHENYAAQVLGDSMEPEFPDKCIVIIHPSESAYNGAYVFAEVEGVRWFRQYMKDADGERLVALNDLYPEIYLDKLVWKLLGVVVQRNIRREIKHYHPAVRDAVPVSLN
ncbi:MAG: S24 family peptidase [Gammaproteobacteria bacterium]|nr:S24 family peptidase [Gammaproteobacteria bacterium]MBU1653953.1 S24 family peptidase [Gammaproteobacteria bacterium]MBU1960157.1 S24 family peptidase [Gammaproteobacteria bacterium]